MASVHYLVMFATKFNYSYLFFVLAASHLLLVLAAVAFYDFQLHQKMRKTQK